VPPRPHVTQCAFSHATWGSCANRAARFFEDARDDCAHQPLGNRPHPAIEARLTRRSRNAACAHSAVRAEEHEPGPPKKHERTAVKPEILKPSKTKLFPAVLAALLTSIAAFAPSANADQIQGTCSYAGRIERTLDCVGYSRTSFEDAHAAANSTRRNYSSSCETTFYRSYERIHNQRYEAIHSYPC
jgi:hypothetical protein